MAEKGKERWALLLFFFFFFSFFALVFRNKFGQCTERERERERERLKLNLSDKVRKKLELLSFYGRPGLVQQVLETKTCN